MTAGEIGGVPPWLIGVVINILGSVSINFGTNLMKLSHTDREKQLQKTLEMKGLQATDELRTNSTAANNELDSSKNSEGQDFYGWLSRKIPFLKSYRSSRIAIDATSPHSAQAHVSTDDAHNDFRGHWQRPRTWKSYFLPDKPWKIWLREKLWHAGTTIFVSGSICTFVSFAYAPQSMLAALGSVQFVSNVIFARFVLGERITLRVVCATMIIIGGQVLIVIFSSHKSSDYDAKDLMALYNSTFLSYMGVLAVVGGSLMLVYKQYRRFEAEGRDLPYSNTVLPVTYAMASAMAGTFSVLQAKCLSELLGRTMQGDNQLKFFFTWFVFSLWILLTVFWLHRMNTALRLFDGIFIIPVLQVFWTFFAIMVGGIFFQEFQTYTPKMLGLFVTGVLTIFLGVILLSPRRSVAEREEFEEMHDEEEGVQWEVEAQQQGQSPLAGVIQKEEQLSPIAALTTSAATAHNTVPSQGGEDSGSSPIGSGAAVIDMNHPSSVGPRRRSQQGKEGSSSNLHKGTALQRRGSLEVLETKNLSLYSLNSMPFVSNDESFANFLDHIAPPAADAPILHEGADGSLNGIAAHCPHVRQGSSRDVIVIQRQNSMGGSACERQRRGNSRDGQSHASPESYVGPTLDEIVATTVPGGGGPPHSTTTAAKHGGSSRSRQNSFDSHHSGTSDHQGPEMSSLDQHSVKGRNGSVDGSSPLPGDHHLHPPIHKLPPVVEAIDKDNNQGRDGSSPPPPAGAM